MVKLVSNLNQGLERQIERKGKELMAGSAPAMTASDLGSNIVATQR